MQIYLISNFLDVFTLLLELKTFDMAELSLSRNEAEGELFSAIR